MPKHAAPAPALFSRPGTYLVAAASVTGAMVGALPAPAPVAAAVAAPVALVLALLAAAPAPGERATDPRHRQARRIPGAVYIGTVAALLVAWFGPRSPLESEAATGSHPLESEAAGYRMLADCWCGCGGGMLVAEMRG